MINSRTVPICFFVFYMLFTSCNNKNYIYLYEKDHSLTDTLKYKPVKTNYIVQPNDILHIDFYSALSNVESYFSFSSGSSTELLQASGPGMYLNQYVVSDSGYIRIPVIGSVYVAGYTITNIEKLIEREARKYIDDAISKVKLLNYKITFIGEFGNPGEKYFYRDRVNIIDALVAAGDVTYYGDRKNLRVLRQTPKGIESFRINLHDVALLNSKDFYLKPNDIVYAEPLPRKIFRLQTSDYSVLLVTISTTLAFISVILNLK